MPDVADNIQNFRTSADIANAQMHKTTTKYIGLANDARKADGQGVKNGGLADSVDPGDEVEAGPEAKLGRLDRADVLQFEARNPHAVPSTSIWPVTAAAIRAVRRSLSSAMVFRVLAASSSSRAVSRLR